MKVGKVDAVIVVPAGYGQTLAAATAAGGGAPTSITVYTDPSRSALVGEVYQAVGSVLGVVNLGGRPPLVIPDARDVPDREPQRDQLLRAEHARPVGHAGRDLRGDPAGGRSREADPQAPGGHAAATLAADRQQRAHAAAHRAGPDRDHRGRRHGRVRRPDHRQPAGRWPAS